jgi:hypothetical protein
MPACLSGFAGCRRVSTLCERIEAGYAGDPEAEGLAEIDAPVAASRAER